MAKSRISKTLNHKMDTMSYHPRYEAYLSNIKSWEAGNNNSKQTNTLTVLETGLYLVKMAVRLCGANSSSGTHAAYFHLYRNNTEVTFWGDLKNVVMPIPKIWDNPLILDEYFNFTAGDTVYLRVAHDMDVATSKDYPSQITLVLLKVSDTNSN